MTVNKKNVNCFSEKNFMRPARKTLAARKQSTSCGPQDNPCGPQAESKLSGILCFPNRKLLNTDFKSQNVSNYQKY
jgi:hypothetical protein